MVKALKYKMETLIAFLFHFLVDQSNVCFTLFYDTVLVDKHASPNSSYVQSFWHGFSDIGSGIETYEYCVSSGVEEGTCDIQPLSEVGIATRIQITPKDSLGQGTTFLLYHYSSIIH
jgi:hypothetical protein